MRKHADDAPMNNIILFALPTRTEQLLLPCCETAAAAAMAGSGSDDNNIITWS